MSGESALMRRIQLAASKLPGLRLFRNNVGVGWAGRVEKFDGVRTVTVGPQDVVIRNARPLHAGLVEGSGDLIGWNAIEVGPEMIGKNVAVFASAEVKTITGRMSPEQKNWLSVVNRNGGIAIVTRSEQETLDGIARRVEDLKTPGMG